jgi:hypothetical protein
LKISLDGFANEVGWSVGCRLGHFVLLAYKNTPAQADGVF